MAISNFMSAQVNSNGLRKSTNRGWCFQTQSTRGPEAGGSLQLIWRGDPAVVGAPVGTSSLALLCEWPAHTHLWWWSSCSNSRQNSVTLIQIFIPHFCGISSFGVYQSKVFMMIWLWNKTYIVVLCKKILIIIIEPERLGKVEQNWCTLPLSFYYFFSPLPPHLCERSSLHMKSLSQIKISRVGIKHPRKIYPGGMNILSSRIKVWENKILYCDLGVAI